MLPEPSSAVTYRTGEAETPAAAAALSRLRSVTDWFCAGLITVLIVAGLLAVLRRFAARLPVIGDVVLSGNLSWPDPLAQHLVLWVALFGACAAAADRSHIAIDALSYVLPARGRRLAGVVTNLVAVVVCAVFAWLSVGFAVDEFTNNPEATTFFGVHTCWLALVLPVGFALLALSGLAISLSDLQALLRAPPPSVTPKEAPDA